MRVLVFKQTPFCGTKYIYGEFDVLAETDIYYKIGDVCLESSCSWVKKTDCEIIRKPEEKCRN